jgi:hypothetical protein
LVLVVVAVLPLFVWISFRVWHRHDEISTESRSLRRLAWIG